MLLPCKSSEDEVIPLLRLYLDANEGVALIPCGACGRPMVLACERMGRTLVWYRTGFSIRPGHMALLVCPELDCDYRETVEIARTPTDAVVFSPVFAADRYQVEHSYYQHTLDEIKAEFDRLVKLYARTRNPKLPSIIRSWREDYSMSYWDIRDTLEMSLKEGFEVSCEFKEGSVCGKVTALLAGAVMLNRTQDGETVLVRTGELQSVGYQYQCQCQESQRQKFDFGDNRRSLDSNIRSGHGATTFVVYGGQTLALDGVTRHRICRVHTDDPEVARAVGLTVQQRGRYMGEFPSALADRVFKVIRYCWVGKYRLHVSSLTNDPYVLQLGTRDMETARELGMTRGLMAFRSRRSLRWWGSFHRDEITGEEEFEVPIRMPRARRR